MWLLFLHRWLSHTPSYGLYNQNMLEELVQSLFPSSTNIFCPITPFGPRHICKSMQRIWQRMIGKKQNPQKEAARELEQGVSLVKRKFKDHTGLRVEAQIVAKVYLALENNLKIILVSIPF
ncbi:hypothetical protein HKD37_15G042118 [Glycine soja]